MIGLFYDTETTGLPLYKERSTDPRQPHIVEIAAKLVDLDNNYRVIRTLHNIVEPDGWEISEEVSKVHGITHEYALIHGICEHATIMMFYQNMFAKADIVIGHNVSFDNRIIRIAMKRYMMGDAKADSFKGGNFSCTMRNSKDIVKAPPTAKQVAAGFTKCKNPRLEEAYEYFTGKPLDGAHCALIDVDATIEVYRGINLHNQV